MEVIGEVTAGGGRAIEVARGWSAELAERLVVHSREETISHYTPRDAAERFVDVESAQQWYDHPDKAPVVYVLGLSDIALHGVAWFSRQRHADIPDASHSFAIRMYDTSRGQGLSYPFAKIAHDDFTTRAQPEGIWLETDISNQAAISLYRRLNYRHIPPRRGRITMFR